MLRISRTHRQYDPATVRRSVSDRFSVEAVGSAFQAIYQRVLGHGR
jgi:hypothetical protein